VRAMRLGLPIGRRLVDGSVCKRTARVSLEGRVVGDVEKKMRGVWDSCVVVRRSIV